jgi:hypothetical protein
LIFSTNSSLLWNCRAITFVTEARNCNQCSCIRGICWWIYWPLEYARYE